MDTLPPLPLDDRNRVRRLAHYQRTDRAELYALLDEALVAHVAFIRNAEPVVLPLGFARDGDSILLHGSTGSDFFRRLAAGSSISVSVTHLDGLIYARSLFDSSMRYRAAVIHGTATIVSDDHKEDALLVLADHLMPGRRHEVRPMSRREIAATMVLRVPLESASVKDNRTSVAEDADDDEDRAVWAGEIPLRLVAGSAVTSEFTQEHTQLPPSLAYLQNRLPAFQ